MILQINNAKKRICLLYTSDAADDMQCVDLGGRRIIIMGSTMWKQSSNLQVLHYDYYGQKLLWSKWRHKSRILAL